MLDNPEDFYRSFSIPKKSGAVRTILAPSPTLLHVQRWILDNIIAKVGVHDCAFGFVNGKSAVDNASVHVGTDKILKMDLKDFFPSIHIRRGIAVFNRIGYPPTVSFLLARLCFINEKLPQGAPSSPGLSNIIAKKLDARLSALADHRGIKYTRYADDLTFSGINLGGRLTSVVEAIVREEGFEINKDKTVVMRAGSKQIVTGVSVSSGKMKLPKQAVRAIKLNCHFILKRGLMAHFEATGSYDPVIVERMIGHLNFWLQIEPDNAFAKSTLARLKEYQMSLDHWDG